jgi:hypothetical protein
MFRLICVLVLVLLISTLSLGQQSLVGTYKLVSLAVEIDGTPTKGSRRDSTWILHFDANSCNSVLYAWHQKIRHLCE